MGDVRQTGAGSPRCADQKCGAREGDVTEAVPGQPNAPYMRIGGRECVMKVVEHGLALRQINWPKKQEIQEVVTDFGSIRLRSSFKIVEDGPGQVSINIDGLTIERKPNP